MNAFGRRNVLRRNLARIIEKQIGANIPSCGSASPPGAVPRWPRLSAGGRCPTTHRHSLVELAKIVNRSTRAAPRRANRERVCDELLILGKSVIRHTQVLHIASGRWQRDHDHFDRQHAESADGEAPVVASAARKSLAGGAREQLERFGVLDPRSRRVYPSIRATVEAFAAATRVDKARSYLDTSTFPPAVSTL